MAEVILVVGAAAAFSQLAEQTGKTVLKLCRFLEEVRDAPERIRTQVEQTRQLVALLEDIKADPLYHCDELRRVLESCTEKSTKLTGLIDKTKMAESESKTRKLKKAVLSTLKSPECRELFAALEEQKARLKSTEAHAKLAGESVNQGRTEMTCGFEAIISSNTAISGRAERLETNFAVMQDKITVASNEIPFMSQTLSGIQEQLKVMGIAAQAKLSSAPGRYFEVPSRRVQPFVGRKDVLQQIDNAMAQSRPPNGPQVVVISGIGGQGKTQLALEFCHCRKENPFESTFWIDATSEESARAAFTAISQLLGAFGNAEKNREEHVAFVLRQLGASKYQWLLVFDNYNDLDSFSTISDYFPQNERGSILITSQNTSVEELVANPRDEHIQLAGLPRDAAIDLLLQRSSSLSRTLNADCVGAIVQRLGYHALTITQAAAYIKQRQIRPEKFLEIYQAQRSSVLTTKPRLSQYWKKLGNNNKEEVLNTFATLELSYQQLQTTATDKHLVPKLLKLLACFDCQHISEELVKAWPYDELHDKIPGPYLVLEPFFESGTWDTDKFAAALFPLVEFSMLQMSRNDGDDSCVITIHPLVQDWLKLRSSSQDRDTSYAISTILVGTHIKNSWNRKLNQYDLTAATKQHLLLHAIALEDKWSDCKSLGARLGQEHLIGQVLGSEKYVADLVGLEGQTGFAKTMWRRLRVEYSELDGESSIDAVQCLNNLMYNNYDEERWEEAESQLLQVIEMRTMLDPSDLDIVRNMTMLSNVYGNQGRWEEAEALQRKIIDIRTETWGECDLSVLLAEGNLADTLFEMGRYKEAERLGEDVLEILECCLGEKHLRTIQSTKALAMTYAYRGRLEESETLHQRALRLYEEVLGKEDRRTLTQRSNLASTYLMQGHTDKAKATHLEVLEIRERVFGIEHRDTTISMGEVAHILYLQGQAGQGNELYERVVALRRQVLGEKHSMTVDAMRYLEEKYRSQGLEQEADRLKSELQRG